MLISYKVSNFCSFYEQAEFEMLAPNTVVKKRFPDSFVKHFSELEVLRTAVIIGENAGGKTNFIRSLEFLKKMFQNNENAHSFKSLVNINNRENNSRDLDNTCQHFELEILGENGLIYKYILEIDAFGIVKENLSVKKRKNAIYREILATTRKEITHQEEEHKFTLNYELKLSKENEKLEEVLNKAGTYTRNEIGLFVTKLAILGDEHANTFTNWINNNLYVEAMDLNYDIYKNIKEKKMI